MVRAMVHAAVSKWRRLQGFYIWFVLSFMARRSLQYVCIPMDHEQRRQQRLQRRRQPSVTGSKGTEKHKRRREIKEAT